MGACQLADIVWDAVHAVQPATDARKHHLTVHSPLAPVTLHADAPRLTQVLVNLLSNSAKYSPDGSHIEIAAVVEQPSDRDAILSPGSVKFTVTDDGYGLPAEKLPYAFDMFTQLGSRPSMADSGLGIGLALVKYLVGCHGGTVSIASGDGRTGTTVTVKGRASGT